MLKQLRSVKILSGRNLPRDGGIGPDYKPIQRKRVIDKQTAIMPLVLKGEN